MDVRPRVLIYDWRSVPRRFAERTLRDAGIDVFAAASLEAALDACVHFAPSVILVDADSPGAPDLCRIATETQNLADTKFVLLSALPAAATDALARGLEVCDVLRKPFRPEVLLSVVTRCAGRGHQSEPELVVPTTPANVQQREAERVREQLKALLANGPLEDLGPDDLLAFADAIRWTSAEVAIAFQGRLEHLSLSDIVQVIEHQSLSGVLQLEDPLGPRGVQICFGEGKVDLALARGVPDEFLLGRYLLSEDLVTPEDLSYWLRSPGEGRLGTRLIRLGVLDQTDVRRCLARQTEELFYESMRWRLGTFSFFRWASRDEARETPLRLNTTNLLMEGLRRVDEWRILTEQITSFDLCIRCDRGSIPEEHWQRMPSVERRVAEELNGTKTVAEVVQSVRGSSFAVCKAIYALLSARYARVMP